MSEEILKLKLEVEKSNKDFRHEMRNEVQKAIIWLENNMDKQLSEIKSDMKDGFNDIKVMFKELPNAFTTKEEHNTNILEIKYMKERQAKTDKVFSFIASIIGTAIIWAILALVINAK